MSLPINLTIDALKDAFKHQSKQKQKKISELQILIGLKTEKIKEVETKVVAYYLVVDYDLPNKEEVATFKDLTGKLIDLYQLGPTAKQKFPDYLGKIATDKNLNLETTEIMVIPSDDEASQLGLCIWENQKLIKPISFDYFFKESDDEM